VAADLAAFLSRAAARGFCWGEHDCMLFAADWARELTGEDPAAPWRGAYSDEAGAKTILSAAGGMTAIMSGALRGWRKVRDEAAGDIVVASVPHHDAPLAGVATYGGRVALATRRGLVVARVPVMLGWRHG
jgi:uncharacterized protein DUF6950